ncbi:MAG: hypothetical protein QXT63_02660 [Thermoplasmata archaeon]
MPINLKSRFLSFIFTLSIVFILFLPSASAGEITIFDRTISIALYSYQYLPIEPTTTSIESGDLLTISIDVKTGGRIDLLIFNKTNYDLYESDKAFTYYNSSLINVQNGTCKFIIPSKSSFYIVLENANRTPNGAVATKSENVSMKVVWSGKNALPGTAPVPGMDMPNIPGITDSPYSWCLINLILMLIVSVIISVVIWVIRKIYSWWKAKKGNKQEEQQSLQIVTGRMLEEEKAKRAQYEELDSKIRSMEVQVSMLIEKVATLENRLVKLESKLERMPTNLENRTQTTATTQNSTTMELSTSRPSQIPVSKVKCPGCSEIIPIFTTERPLKLKCSRCGREGTLGKKN